MKLMSKFILEILLKTAILLILGHVIWYIKYDYLPWK